MKPITLTMTAFGAYAQPTTIDFTRLGDAGLYLVTGSTGAGKTTIFDALCYALYGEASSKRRDPKTLDSDFNTGNNPAVSLVFEHRGQRYTVSRTKKLYGRKGQLVKAPVTDVLLAMPDGSAIEDTTKVKDKVQELLGLTYEQFKQTAMIAQGEFRDLLEADSKSRTAIMQKLFGTEFYSRMAVGLKARLDGASSLLAANTAAIKSELGHVRVAPESPLAAETGALLDKAMQQSSVDMPPLMALLGKLIAEDASAAQRLTAEHDARHKALVKASAELDQTTTVNRQWERLRELQKEKTALIDDKREWYATEKRVIERQQAANRGKVKEAFDLRKNRRELADECAKQLKQAELVLQRLDISGIDSVDAHLRALVHTGQAAAESLVKVNDELTAAKLTQRQCHSLWNDLWELSEQTVKQVRRDIAAYRDCKAETAQAKHSYDQAQKFWEDNQAVVLAADLKDGCPCPVCGATAHPNPATLEHPCDLTTEMVKQLRQDYEKLADQCIGLDIAAHKSADGFREKAAKLFAQVAQESDVEVPNYRGAALDQCPKIDELYEQVASAAALWRERVRESDERCEKLCSEQQRLREQQSVGAQATKEREALAQRRLDYAKQASQVATLHENDRKQRERAAKAQDEFLEALRTHGFVGENDFNCYKVGEGELVKREHDLRGYENECRKLLSDLEAQQRQLEGKPQVDTAAMAEKRDALAQSVNALAQALGDVKSRREQNEAVLRELRRRDSESASQAKRCALLSELYTLVSGNRKDNVSSDKISLEQYVQAAGFERIVSAANLRLGALSNGRYRLALHTAAAGEQRPVASARKDNASANTALDLDVSDNFTGRSRPVRTLSGGESFAAALSLALGLSDVITGDAGGVSIDTLFIDEGFGSLDSESLRDAVAVLERLSGGAHKQIGIISHREELAESIPRQILVTKTPKGSEVAVRN